MEKLYVGWEQFDEMVHELKEMIPEGKYGKLYGVPRGGLTIAVRLSHLTGIPMDSIIPNRKILVVDDIADSGKTLEGYDSFDTATLFYKATSSKKPTYFVDETDKWVVFPWENP